MSLVTEYLAECGVVFAVIPTGGRAPRSRKPGNWAWPPRSSRRSRCAASKYLLAVVPASRRLELRRVGEMLGDPAARLASEAELQADFPAAMSWALPPLGSLLGVPLLVDPEVLDHEKVLFAAGPRPSRSRSPPPSCSGMSRWPCCR